jgi:hypothetical protein
MDWSLFLIGVELPLLAFVAVVLAIIAKRRRRRGLFCICIVMAVLFGLPLLLIGVMLGVTYKLTGWDFIVAGLGVLLLASIAVVVSILANRRRHRTLCWTGMAMAVLFLISAVLVGQVGLCYGSVRFWHCGCLSATIYRYYEKYGELPKSFETVAKSNGYGLLASAAPAGWDGKQIGPPPLYLPVFGKTDGNFIVAVESRTPRTPRNRCYVILCDAPQVHYAANDEELKKLLVEDDLKREKAGQTGRWASIPWK